MAHEVLEDILKIVLSIHKKLEGLDNKVGRILTVKDFLDGDSLLDVTDLCNILNVTKRTVQRYKQKKLIPYYVIEHKTFFKKSEVEKFVNNFRKGAKKDNI